MKLHLILFILMSLFFLSCGKKEPVTEKADTKFVHPGVINEKFNLDKIRESTLSIDQKATYNEVLAYINKYANYKTYPKIVYVQPITSLPSAKQMREDALSAYALALKWARTGDDEDAKKAMNILNGWAYNFERYVNVDVGAQQLQLFASWVTPTFAAAAEIIRHHKIDNVKGAGWESKDIEQFSSFLRILNSYVDPMVKDIDKGSRFNNWGASAGYTKMAIGVFLEDEGLYSEGMRIINKLIPIVIKPDGEVYELCSRDCTHPQYSLTAFTYSAETARIQGDESLYQANANRIETGWKWLGKAKTGQVSCRDCTDKQIMPAIEVAAHHYSSSTELASYAKIQRPYSQPEGLFIGFTSLTHVNSGN